MLFEEDRPHKYSLWVYRDRNELDFDGYRYRIKIQVQKEFCELNSRLIYCSFGEAWSWCIAVFNRLTP